MRIRWLGAARAEFFAALDWYEGERPGLGEDFLAEVTRSIDLIAERPRAWPPASRPGLGVRRFLVPRYPYAIVYIVEKDELLIVAVAHGKRRPGYWANRLPKGTR